MNNSEELNGAQIVLEALKEQEVDTIFGYPGGAVLPIYDAIFGQNFLKHVYVNRCIFHFFIFNNNIKLYSLIIIG